MHTKKKNYTKIHSMRFKMYVIVSLYGECTRYYTQKTTKSHDFFLLIIEKIFFLIFLYNLNTWKIKEFKMKITEYFWNIKSISVKSQN